MSKIVVFWDAMLDIYIFGNTDRKNPESPMPLLKVEKQEIRLWWASNVAHNIANLNWSVELISLLWDDGNRKLFNKICEEKNIKINELIMDAPTITKTRYLDSQYKQQLLRVDYEEKKKITNDQVWKLKNMLEEIKPEIILISDYDKWIITPESVETVKNYANENNIKILVDIKPKNLELFYDVFLVKPNFKEFCEMMWITWIENTEENITKYGKEFVQRYRTNIVITRGWKWSSLITKQWDVYHIPSEELKVFDVSWAWDTYIATLTYAISNNYSLVDAIKLSNKASWVVVWKVWTAAITREELWFL